MAPTQVILSTGNIQYDYEIIDTIFAIDSSTEGFLAKLSPEQAFEGVKCQLRRRCQELGGQAVVHCQFEYRNALADGFLGKKLSLEIFAYGTAVRILDDSIAQPINESDPGDDGSAWKGEARALLAEGKKIEAVKRVRESTNLGLAEALKLVESWEGEEG